MRRRVPDVLAGLAILIVIVFFALSVANQFVGLYRVLKWIF